MILDSVELPMIVDLADHYRKWKWVQITSSWVFSQSLVEAVARTPAVMSWERNHRYGRDCPRTARRLQSDLHLIGVNALTEVRPAQDSRVPSERLSNERECSGSAAVVGEGSLTDLPCSRGTRALSRLAIPPPNKDSLVIE
jgi:hypothetical protein